MPSEYFFDKYVPPGSFLGQYMKLCDPIETAKEYDFWTGMWALGSILGRRVVVPRGHAPVYMNWYVLLVAASGITRKSTSVKIARDIVRHFSVPIIETRTTTEYLWDTLSDLNEAHAAIAVSELVTFLGKSSYAMDIPGMLTDLYDCPEERIGGGTMSRGARSLNNVFITFLSASTPTWLQEAINPAVVEGGFTSRCMFIVADEPKRKVPWPEFGDTDNSKVIAAAEKLIEQAKVTPMIQLMPDGLKRFKTWYMQRDTSSHDPFIQSFQSREDSHLLRAAAALAVNDGSFAIYNFHINAAIMLLKEVKEGALELFQDTGVPQKLQLGVNRAIETIVAAGPHGITHSRLYMRVRHHLRGDEFNLLMSAMHEHEMVQKFIDKGKGQGRAPVRYVRTSAISNQAKMTALRKDFIG